ncbi:MAG: hypothetical protein ACAH11_02060 [Sphingomonas sp.]
MTGYTEPRRERHRIEFVGGVEQLRLPVRRQIFALLFLPFWLAGWTAGGIFAMGAFIKEPHLFLAVWLCGWAFGWIFVALTIASQVAGAEILRVRAGDLEVLHRIGPIRRRWRYRGGAIRNLTRLYPENGIFARQRMEVPLFVRARSGEVGFEYGSDRITIAAGATGSDGDAIVDWLSARLPGTATA